MSSGVKSTEIRLNLKILVEFFERFFKSEGMTSNSNDYPVGWLVQVGWLMMDWLQQRVRSFVCWELLSSLVPRALLL